MGLYTAILLTVIAFLLYSNNETVLTQLAHIKRDVQSLQIEYGRDKLQRGEMICLDGCVQRRLTVSNGTNSRDFGLNIDENVEIGVYYRDRPLTYYTLDNERLARCVRLKNKFNGSPL